jgi:hypothetical protein
VVSASFAMFRLTIGARLIVEPRGAASASLTGVILTPLISARADTTSTALHALAQLVLTSRPR